MKNHPVNHADLVVKSNHLIPAMARLGLMDLRLLAFCIAHIHMNDTEIEEVTAHASELAEVFDIPIDKTYGLIKEIMISINSKPAEYTIDNKKSLSAWFINIDYLGTGQFSFLLNPRLAPYLIALKENFTSYRLKDVYQFRAASTWHIYEIIRQHKNMTKIEFEIEKFKTLIGVSGQYKRWNNLKFKLIDPAINEINEYSDIFVDYEAVKSGVKVVKIRFFIKPNTTTMTPGEKIKRALGASKDNHMPEFAKLLREEYRVSPKQAKQLANLVWHNDRKFDAEKMLPGIKKRFEGIDKPKTTLGGYVFRTLRDELTRGKLVVEDDPEAEAEATK